MEPQDSARPYHDWNVRVAAECYAPSTAARRIDASGRILEVVNNFEEISFDMGPTLLHWLLSERPDVYERILAADRASAVARGGHGNALAQAYNHVIMPLASRRDKVTQVRWGLADFRFRFGREAEGMWLPETAADPETLGVLAEHGVAFTILSPAQAARVRPAGGEEWREVSQGLDPSRPYRWSDGRGRGLAVFFYDAPISHAIAFEGLLRSGEEFAERLVGAFDAGRDGPQLVHVATDGESYGHHHPFGEMALATACHQLGQARLTNYGAFLAACPPVDAVEIVPGSSWSCVHGLERWRADCGCSSGRTGWHQRWRGPLRVALDWLRDQVDRLYEARAHGLVRDPWAARDDYIDVILDRSGESVRRFLARHARRPIEPAERVEVLKLLELQRHRLLMYTSCGWFFDEVSGIETVQVLRYAARAIQLARELGSPPELEAAFVARLAEAPSNIPELGAGDEVYRRTVLPAVVDLRRVIAHHAIAGPYAPYQDEARVYAYTVSRLDWRREAYGDTSLAAGRVRATSEVTDDSEEALVAVLHFGGHDFHGAIRGGGEPAELEAIRDELFERFARHGLAEVVRAFDRHFPDRTYGIRDLFLEERRRILVSVIEGTLRRYEDTYRRLYEDNRRLMQYLAESDAPAPEALVLAARYVLQREVERVLPALTDDDGVAERLGEILTEARSLGLDLAPDPARVAGHLERALLWRLARLWDGEVEPDGVERVLAVLQFGQRLGCPPDLWAAQNRLFQAWRTAGPELRRALYPLGEALGLALESP